MKHIILILLLFSATTASSQESSMFIRAAFTLTGGTFTQTINGKIIMSDSKGSAVEIVNPEFKYTGMSSGAVALVGYNFDRMYIMAGAKSFVLTTDEVSTNFTLDNVGMPDPINYGMGTLRIEYDLLKSRLFYFAPMAGTNYVFNFDNIDNFFDDGRRSFSYSAGVSLGVEVKRFKFLLTPVINNISLKKDNISNKYKDSGAELGIYVTLFESEKK